MAKWHEEGTPRRPLGPVLAFRVVFCSPVRFLGKKTKQQIIFYVETKNKRPFKRTKGEYEIKHLHPPMENPWQISVL